MNEHTLSDELKRALIERARDARQWAYAPYSKYRVGAALLTASGRIYDGVNVENASYPATVCAERTAALKAVSEGEREFVAIAVVSGSGGAPCGICRQMLSEFSPDMLVLIADTEGKVKREVALHDLFPDAFGPQDLT